MTDAFRGNLRPVVDRIKGAGTRLDNPGLALDRYQPNPIGEAGGLDNLLNAVCGASPPAIYAEAYKEWKRAILAHPSARERTFRVRGRMIVGLGAESTRETGITLLHPYGVPVIPGSALKGLARHYAETALAGHDEAHPFMPRRTRKLTPQEQAEDDQKVHPVIFGSTVEAAYLTYFDAWYIPDSVPGNRPLCRDVITPHHPRYYGTGGSRAPWDLDDPIPVSFLAATGRYLVVARGPDGPSGPAWAESTLDLLERALDDWGIGGKTSSGYGRMERVIDTTELLADIAKPTTQPEVRAALDDLFARVKALPERERAEAARHLFAKLQSVNLGTTNRAKVVQGWATKAR